mgnify:CR=1 FL=1
MTTEQNPKKAMWLSLIPGLGQIYNKQKTKGYIFLAVTVLFLAYFLGIGVGELAKLVTLGTVRGQDNSLYLDSWRLPLDHYHCLLPILCLKY